MVDHTPTLIQSVQRAFRLVEAISARDGRASAKELARATGLSLSTTYHLLRTLAHDGYVTRQADGTYTLGHALRTMVAQPDLAATYARLRPTIIGMRDELRAPVYLAMLHDGEISVVEIAESTSFPSIDLWVGIHEAAHATALGKSILAAMDDQQRTAYLRTHPLHPLTRRTVTDERCLLERIGQSTAIARDDGEYLPGVSCLAVPIRTSTMIGAVGVARSGRTHPPAADAETLAILRAGAGRLSRTLQLAAAL